jgi:hypothetical protein
LAEAWGRTWSRTAPWSGEAEDDFEAADAREESASGMADGVDAGSAGRACSGAEVGLDDVPTEFSSRDFAEEALAGDLVGAAAVDFDGWGAGGTTAGAAGDGAEIELSAAAVETAASEGCWRILGRVNYAPTISSAARTTGIA